VIRITNFKRGTVGRYAEGGHPGDPMVLFTVHIKNGTSHKVDADEFSVEVSYGPDDDIAEAISDNGLDDVTGVIAKAAPRLVSMGSRSRSSTWTSFLLMSATTNTTFSSGRSNESGRPRKPCLTAGANSTDHSASNQAAWTAGILP
jgi:hypothetical protein